MNNIPFHEIANIFPLIHGKEFVELKEDIKQNGCIEPIVLYEGQILDGRNRFRACQEVGVQPEYIDYEGDDPLSHVISLNIHRRHLDESQRAMVGAKIANLEQGKYHGNQHEKLPANLRGAQTQAQAADLMQVSERSVNKAKKVQKEGAEELIEAVEEGQVSVSAAANIIDLPKLEQAKLAEQGKPAVIDAGKKRMKKIPQNKNIQQFLKAIGILSNLVASPEIMFKAMTDKEKGAVYDDNERAYNLVKLMKEVIDNASTDQKESA
ncbi:MAG: ParB/RepB/Spo0J family partition protein [Candidatus Thiodiazotropha taylori]|uniref:ParB/RepB/Spo0J family partition protein n=1 Tax=Candidatus Thiodiazotropha taylori TaxID=2792791 RepID=A0A9E4N4G1_9GAMM|nr:ParB/RepB/Spo0J family partition protein [Candidatus Thiodiazotropha taylori]MCW4255956.1 ParB/RepB/Spo0J family partition protein [Candidatus Thiodiazotropha taylori]